MELQAQLAVIEEMLQQAKPSTMLSMMSGVSAKSGKSAKSSKASARYAKTERSFCSSEQSNTLSTSTTVPESVWGQV